jgi:hypothetical protein
MTQLTSSVFTAAEEFILTGGQIYISHKSEILYEYNLVDRRSVKMCPQ